MLADFNFYQNCVPQVTYVAGLREARKCRSGRTAILCLLRDREICIWKALMSVFGGKPFFQGDGVEFFTVPSADVVLFVFFCCCFYCELYELFYITYKSK